MTDEILRRPIRTRDTRWAGAVAGWLARRGIRPNTISIMSVVFALGAGACLVALGRAESLIWRVGLPLGAALGIQLRLLCNLFDGMVAVEQQQRTKSGEIYNELPDRFADSLILAGAGYAAVSPPWLVELGWVAAVLAVITAYVRSLGAAVGAGQFFLGPMAKQHRMALMTGLCVGLAVTPNWSRQWLLIAASLALISMGCMVTIARRSARVVRELESRRPRLLSPDCCVCSPGLGPNGSAASPTRDRAFTSPIIAAIWMVPRSGRCYPPRFANWLDRLPRRTTGTPDGYGVTWRPGSSTRS